MHISNHFLGATSASLNDGRQELVLLGLISHAEQQKKALRKTHHTVRRKPHEDLMKAGFILLTITTPRSNISPNLHLSHYPGHAPTHRSGCGLVMQCCREGWELVFSPCSAAGVANLHKHPAWLHTPCPSPLNALHISALCYSEEQVGDKKRHIRLSCLCLLSMMFRFLVLLSRQAVTLLIRNANIAV